MDNPTNKNIYRSSLFIVQTSRVGGEEDRTFLSPPDSWSGGWARHTWFSKLTGVKPSIASKEQWGKMLDDEKNQFLMLLEYTDKSWEIVKDF